MRYFGYYGDSPIWRGGGTAMKKTSSKLPGSGIRILSFIPVFNSFALIYIGAANGNLVNIVCGAAYFLVSIAVPGISFFLWIMCIIHYSVAYKEIKKQMKNSSSLPATHPESTYNTTSRSGQKFSDVTLSGTEERKQSIPTLPTYEPPSVTVSFSYESSQDRFYKDMKKYENKSGTVVPFVPFMTYWPTYESMSGDQQSWYFYWRTEVRNENYINTDLSYIFIYIYELLNGVGWKTQQEGYEKLVRIWKEYQQRFPKMDAYLHSWTFDFANLHNLEQTKAIECNTLRLAPSVKTDLLIDRYSSDTPLKLPFALIDALCDYSLVGSKFYKDGHQSLMHEAIPRVVALADAVLRKEKNKGILEIYGPNRTKKQEYYAFASAVCPQANNKISVSVKAYSTSQNLRGYINELVRYAENTLRSLYGYRGRLRGITLDEKTAKLVDSFLKKEYGNIKPAQPEQEKHVVVELDFASIDTLREQSDAVRTALQVEETESVMEKELLTDVAEVTAVFVALTPGARAVLNRLHELSWEGEKESNDEASIAEINRLAEHYLGCHLLAVEEGIIIAEDDYRDELDFIYQNPPSRITTEVAQDDFNLESLNETLREFVSQLVPEQRKTLYCIVVQENVKLQLEQIAEAAMTMPQLLVDDINEVAMRILGDIVIDLELKITEEYETELKKST